MRKLIENIESRLKPQAALLLALLCFGGSLFAQAEPTFNKVLASFHSGGAEEMLPKEDLKVANLDDVSKKPPVDDDSTVSRFGIPTAVLVVLGIIVLAGYRRRKNR